MDSLSLDPAKFQPMQLRFAGAGAAGARFDALLGESRARVEPDDLGSQELADSDRREDAPERNEGTEPYPEPRRDEGDDGRAAEQGARGDRRAADAETGEPGDALAAARRDSAAEVADTARPIETSQAKAGKSTTVSEHSSAAGVTTLGRTPASAQGPRSGPSPSLYGSILRTAESVKPRGQQSTLSAARLATTAAPPVAPPQGALGAQAALAAQNVAVGAAAPRTGAQSADPGKATVQNQATAMANAEAASRADATGSEAARKVAVGSKNSKAQQSSAAAQTARSAGVAPTSSTPSAPAGAATAAGSTFAGYAGSQTLVQPGFTIPSIGLAASPSADYAVPSTRPAASLLPTAEQVAIQIHKAANAGQEKINIRLYPAELGRIEVRLEWADDGALRAVISAERSETLDLLQRDARALDRALQDAGLKTDSGSLSFDQRGHAENRDGSSDSETGTTELSDETSASDEAAGADADTAQRKAAHDGLLDLSV